MGRILHCWIAVPAAIAVIGVSIAAATTIAPSTPVYAQPPAPEEQVPPLPPNIGAATWLPGHWRWTGIAGTEWQWEQGRYVAWPRDRTTAADDQEQPTPNARVWGDVDWH